MVIETSGLRIWKEVEFVRSRRGFAVCLIWRESSS